jgi:hypothetical protein
MKSLITIDRKLKKKMEFKIFNFHRKCYLKEKKSYPILWIDQKKLPKSVASFLFSCVKFDWNASTKSDGWCAGDQF